MALIKMQVELKDLEGKEIKGPKEGKNLTLLDVCRTGLLNYDDKMSGEKKYDNFKLAQKLEKAPKAGIELTAEEVANIKALVGKSQFPMIVGLVWDLLEGKDPYS